MTTLDEKRMPPLEPDFARFNGTNARPLQDSHKISKLLGYDLLEQCSPQPELRPQGPLLVDHARPSVVDVDPYTFETYGTLFPSELRFEDVRSANESRGVESEFEHVASAEHVIISGAQHLTRNVSDSTETKVDATSELPYESTDVVRYNRTVIKLLPPLVALVIIIAIYLRRAPVHRHGPHSSRCEQRQRARATSGARWGRLRRALVRRCSQKITSLPGAPIPCVRGSLSSAGGCLSKARSRTS